MTPALKCLTSNPLSPSPTLPISHSPPLPISPSPTLPKFSKCKYNKDCPVDPDEKLLNNS